MFLISCSSPEREEIHSLSRPPTESPAVLTQDRETQVDEPVVPVFEEVVVEEEVGAMVVVETGPASQDEETQTSTSGVDAAVQATSPAVLVETPGEGVLITFEGVTVSIPGPVRRLDA